MSDHVKRFYAAVTALVTYGDIKQRLISAFEEHLADIEEDELPVCVRADFVKLQKAITGVEPLNGEGPIKATVRKMSVYEAGRCAERILEIYAELARLGDELEEIVTPVVDVEDQKVVPAFLVKSG